MSRVKVAIDVCIPQRLVRLLQTGFGDLGYEFIYEAEFAAANAADEFWAGAFRRFGGAVILSADKNIGRRLHQIRAFQENDLICFFCDSRWAGTDLAFKLAHMVYWWPHIHQHLANCEPRDCWWIPMNVSPAPFRKIIIPAEKLQAKVAKTK